MSLQEQDIPELEEPQQPTVSDSEIINQVNAARKCAEDDSKTIRDTWDKLWQLYNNQYDFSKKLQWQSKGFLPCVSDDAGFISGRLKATLTDCKDDWFKVEGATKEGELVAPILAKIIADNLHREQFLAMFEGNLEAGLLTCSPAFKAYPVDDSTFAGYVRIEPLDMRTIFRDPSRADKFRIHRTLIEFADLERDAKAMGYRQETVEKMKGFGGQSGGWSDMSARFEESAKMMGLGEALATFKKPVLIDEYWGPVYDREGNRSCEFGRVVIANEKELLVSPFDNVETGIDEQTGEITKDTINNDPYHDGKGCIIDGDIKPRPFSPYGKAYFEGVMPLVEWITKCMNVIMDSAALSSVNPVLGDSTCLTMDTIRQCTDGGVVPGQFMLADGDVSRALQVIPMGVFHGELLNLLQFLFQRLENSTAATELARGLDQSTGTAPKTLGEYTSKVSEASRQFSNLALGIEERVLEPLISRMLHFYSLKLDLNDPYIRELCEQEILEAGNQLQTDAVQSMGTMAPDTLIINELNRIIRDASLEVKVHGLSEVIAREENINKLHMAVAEFSQTPLAPRIDLEAYAKTMLRLQNIPFTAVFYSDEAWQNKQEEMAQQQAQMPVLPQGAPAQPTQTPLQ